MTHFQVPERAPILYIDDEEDNLAVFKSSFRRHYEVLATTSVDEALQILSEREIPVIITDQRMPLCTGVELLQRLPSTSSAVRIILTGYSDIEVIIRAINECAIFGYITKPWDKADLENTIQQALSKFYLSKANSRLVEDLQQANEGLEEKVRLRTKELTREKERTHQLLLNILPQEVAAELMRRGKVRPRRHDEVTILFLDIVDFTQLTERIEAEDLVEELDYYYKIFDTIFGKHGVEKIKTIGDAYLAVAGVPTGSRHHARHMIEAAMEVLSFLKAEDRQRSRSARPSFQVRIGVHSGSVITGVVGHTKFAYDVWGDDVNVASRIEANGRPGQINVSQSTYQLTKDHFDYEYRGKIEAKHKGELDMYFLRLPE